MIKLFSRQTKSAMNGPIASCRTNLKPLRRRSRNANQSFAQRLSAERAAFVPSGLFRAAAAHELPLTRLASLGTLSPFHGERERKANYRQNRPAASQKAALSLKETSCRVRWP